MSTTLERLQYGFDRDSRRTWRRRALSAIEDNHYGYDGLGQVVSAARGSLNLNTTAISGRPADEQAWGYDPTGNWSDFTTAQNGNPILDQHRVHDRGNRLTQIVEDPVSMLLDRSGRMLQMSPDADGQWDGAMELTWDAWSRITSVKSNGTVVGTYEYDGMSRRTTRTVSGITTHSYYSDTWRPLEERLAGQTTAAIQYLWGARHRDDLVRRDRATTSGGDLDETRYVLMDYFSPAAITDASGTVTERYGFSAFGVRRIMAPDFSPLTVSECAFEFGFQGQFLDTESGLIDYGYRYYSPHLGRWTCKDPIMEQGGMNLYRMAGNGAVNRVDHLGLFAIMECNRCKGTLGPMSCITYESGAGAVSSDPFMTNEGKNTGTPIPAGNYNLKPKLDGQMDPENRGLPVTNVSQGLVSGPGGKPEFPPGTPSITGLGHGLQPGQPTAGSNDTYRVHFPGESTGCITTDQCGRIQDMMQRNPGETQVSITDVACKKGECPHAPTGIRRALPA